MSEFQVQSRVLSAAGVHASKSILLSSTGTASVDFHAYFSDSVKNKTVTIQYREAGGKWQEFHKGKAASGTIKTTNWTSMSSRVRVEGTKSIKVPKSTKVVEFRVKLPDGKFTSTQKIHVVEQVTAKVKSTSKVKKTNTGYVVTGTNTGKVTYSKTPKNCPRFILHTKGNASLTDGLGWHAVQKGKYISGNNSKITSLPESEIVVTLKGTNKTGGTSGNPQILTATFLCRK